MKKGILIIVIVLVVLILFALLGGVALFFVMQNNNKNNVVENNISTQNNNTVSEKNNNTQNAINSTNTQSKTNSNAITSNSEFEVVPSMNVEVSDNTLWCGTINLLWNDIKTSNGKKETEEYYVGSAETLKELNKYSFSKKDISSNTYYFTHELKTNKVKQEIQNNISKLSNTNSKVLDKIQFSDTTDRQLLYSFLSRNIEFTYQFNKLGKRKFNNNQSVECFGIEGSSSLELRNQIKVQYYNSETDFAVKLISKSGDEIILVSNPEGENFKEIYTNYIAKAYQYLSTNNNCEFGENDTFSCPIIKIDQAYNYSDIENVDLIVFYTGEVVQETQFSIGNDATTKQNSELGQAQTTSTLNNGRKFNFDNTFAVFAIDGNIKNNTSEVVVDRLITDYTTTEFQRQNNGTITQDKLAMKRVWDAAAKARLELKEEDEATIKLPFIAGGTAEGVHLECKVTNKYVNDAYTYLQSILAKNDAEHTNLSPYLAAKISVINEN